MSEIEQASRDRAASGSIRFNTDSSRLEIYNGEAWWEIDSTSPELQTGGTRGLVAGGYTPSMSDVIDFFNVSTTGNASDFGDLAGAKFDFPGQTSSRTRAIFGGGYYSGQPRQNTIEFVTIASQGDAQDFGELQQSHQYTLDGASNSTRALAWGGAGPNTDTATNVIEFITIASKGNGINFGDMTRATKSAAGATASSTRSVCLGGNSENIIEYVEIATQGNAVDFGDATSGRNNAACFSNGHGGL